MGWRVVFTLSFFLAACLGAAAELDTTPVPTPAVPNTPVAAPADARTLYNQGKYQESLDTLQRSGLKSAGNFYNAGNCLYRMGKIGQALAYFEKARTLAPSDPDVAYNRGLAEDVLKKNGALPKDSSLWTGTLVPLLRRMPAEAPMGAVIFFSVLVGTLGLINRRRGRGLMATLLNPGFLAVLTLWAISGGFLASSTIAQRTIYAAILADSGVVRSGPGASFTELQRLPAGAKVELTGESRDGWNQIRFSLGNVGWIMEKDVLSL
jgi:hypothetical protein